MIYNKYSLQKIFTSIQNITYLHTLCMYVCIYIYIHTHTQISDFPLGRVLRVCVCVFVCIYTYIKTHTNKWLSSW